MADQTQRLEIATVKAEVGSNILFRFANDEISSGSIPTDSGIIQNLKQVIAAIVEDGTEKISVATTIYQSAAAGLAATSDGGIFLVQSAATDEIYSVWKNLSGSAVNTGKTAMSSQAIQTALDASNEAAQAAEGAADLAVGRTAAFIAPKDFIPATRDNGLPLEVGDRYLNTVDQTEYIYKNGGWQANESLGAIAEIKNNLDPSKGAGEVGYIAAVAGSHPRHVADKLNEVISVADFGAVLDNFTDNTSAVQLAIDSLAPTVYIPAYCRYKRSALVRSDQCNIVDDSLGVRVSNSDATWKPSPSRYLRIAHRGFAGLAPENTMTAFSNAARLGADILELDVQISSDGIPVVIHDDTVDRTSSGTGAVKSMTFAQLNALDNGSKFSARFSGSKIPKFEDVLKFAKSRAVGICAEIKGYRTQADIDLMLNVISQNQADNIVSLQSFNFSDLRYVRTRNKRIELCPLSLNIDGLDEVAAMGGKVTLLLQSSGVLANPSWVSLCRASGVDVGAWTANTAEEVKSLLAIGVTKIISNFYIGDAA